MEFKEILKIIIERKVLFIIILLLTVFLVIGWLLFQPKKYQASLSVDITREKVNETTDYQYDQYYRLLADEKFADTVVQWTSDPQLVKEIFDEAGIKKDAKKLSQFSQLIKGEKLSANFIRIRFDVGEKEEAEKLANSIEKIFTEKTVRLNESAKDTNWFKLSFSPAIIVKYHPGFIGFFLAGIAGGILLGIFACLFHYYWKDGR
ncbi:MAG: Wzz/FepE/Etk N-terminal domain-containing protein [Candidatus Moranbacteria bacterium]|jgi:capsular polysaccharide biosynthesis protein|nr:Wzz/FepE/Etk N-terminal domain-containing protein [Candidatus Moranbacteria bacterium]